MDKKSLLSVHLAVLLFGTSGVFIKIIPMSALLLTLGRGIFSALALYAFIHFREYSLRLERLRDYFWNLLAGIFLAMHWFCYSNVQSHQSDGNAHCQRRHDRLYLFCCD